MSHEDKVDLFKDLVAGAVGGVFGVVVGHPIDTIKVKLQTMPVPAPGEAPKYTGSFDCGRKVIAREGFFKGLYKGVWPPIISGTPINAACFFSFGVGKQLQQSNANEKLTYSQTFIAGMISGVGTTYIIAPTERVKCLLQAQNGNGYKKKRFKGTIDCVVKLVKEDGYRSLFKGSAVTALREIPSSGVYFTTYEWSKDHFFKSEDESKENALQVIFAGGLAGVGYWLNAMPFDVIKSRIQTSTSDHRIKHVFSKLMRKEGIGALYRGADAVLLRAFPTNAVIFLGYEVTLDVLDFLFPN